MPGREIGDKRDVCLLAGATAVAAAFGISFAIGVLFFFFFLLLLPEWFLRCEWETVTGEGQISWGHCNFKFLKVKFVI